MAFFDFESLDRREGQEDYPAQAATGPTQTKQSSDGTTATSTSSSTSSSRSSSAKLEAARLGRLDPTSSNMHSQDDDNHQDRAETPEPNGAPRCQDSKEGKLGAHSKAGSAEAEGTDAPLGCDVQILVPKVQSPLGSRRVRSQARAWFELKHFFGANTSSLLQRDQSGPSGGDWRAAYSKELILNNALALLRSDGYCMIDAWLLREEFEAFVGGLIDDVPESGKRLSEHLPASRAVGLATAGSLPGPDSPWVGDKLQLDRQARSRATSALTSSSDPTPLPSPLLGSMLNLDVDTQTPATSIQPANQRQFLQFMRRFLDVVGEHTASGMSLERCGVRGSSPNTPKVHVQFFLGGSARPGG